MTAIECFSSVGRGGRDGQECGWLARRIAIFSIYRNITTLENPNCVFEMACDGVRLANTISNESDICCLALALTEKSESLLSSLIQFLREGIRFYTIYGLPRNECLGLTTRNGPHTGK